MKHLLKLSDWSEKEIIETLNLADQLKFEKKNGIEHYLLKGKTLGMIFEKSSRNSPSMRQPSTRSFILLKILRKVDLPHPEGPIRAVTCFSGISIFIFFKA